MADRREQDQQWYFQFNERHMIIVLTDPAELDEHGERAAYDDLDFGPVSNVVAAHWEVCGTCDGKGTHVNPAIDSHGLSREDFDEDPDFAQDYFSGAYDVPCHECHGRRVAPAVTDARLTAAQRQAIETIQNDFYRERAEREAERRYGY